jgi:hypothetical protein
MPTKSMERSKPAKKNTIAVPMTLSAGKRGEHILIRLVAPGQAPVTVSNDPESARFHPSLFRNLRKTLIANGAWRFGDEGSDAVSLELQQEAEYFQQTDSRFKPVLARGGQSASELLLRDRERF